MSRKRVARGIYLVRSCTCGYPPVKHQVYDVVVGAGRDPYTGKYLQDWKRHHGNLTTAREARRLLIGELKEGRLDRTTATLADLFTRWLADVEARGGAPSTIQGYKATRTYWRTLEDRPLHRISRADVKDVLAALVARGVSNRHALATLSAAYTWAVQEDWLPAHEDPTKKIRRSAKVNRIPQVPTPAEVQAVLYEARMCGRPEMERLVFLAAVTGCRPSELRGLRITDIDMSRGIAGLVRAMSAEVEWTLKNRKERQIGLDEVTMAVVRAQVDFMAARALACGTTLRADAFLFSDDPTGAAALSGWVVSKWGSMLFDHAGRPDGPACTHKAGVACPRPGPLARFTFMHLRRFMDTYGHDLGFSTNEVAARAGHDPAVARRHYVGAVEGKDRALSAGLAGLLSPAT